MGIFLIVGSPTALASARGTEVASILQGRGLTVEMCSMPASLKCKVADYSHMLLLIDSSMPPMADAWGLYFKRSPSLVAVALVSAAVPGAFKKFFKFQHEWLWDDVKFAMHFTEWCKKIVVIPTGYESATAMFSEPELDALVMSPSLEKSFVSEDMMISVDEGSRRLDVGFVASDDSVSVVAEDFSDMLSNAGVSVSFNPDQASAESDSFSMIEDMVDVGVASSEDLPALDAGPLSDQADEGLLDSISEAQASLSVAQKSDLKDLGEQPVPASLEELSGDAKDSQTSQVVKRYALLKEKENREKQKTIDILRSELEKAKSAMLVVQADKRRTMLKVDEIEADRRALQETVDELRHKVSLSDGETTQKIKDYQSRLENSQFLAKRFEKKLEDFKLRVRLDIQKIRARERELENRLELQKRDAEALLGTKDSRLLNQKREIDKMQFEMEILKERLVEETERAEERNEKLHRALQSLKMAQGMLSGIDEGVISTSERDSGEGSGGEAA